MPRRKGFTLVEMIVTAFILCTLLAVGIPNYISFKAKQACSRAADIIMADLNLCKERAIAIDASKSAAGVFCGIEPVQPSPHTEYMVYELVVDPSTLGPAMAAPKCRTVTLPAKGSLVQFIIVPANGSYSASYIDFYRRPEDDWTGMIVVASGSHYCIIYVGKTGPGIIERDQAL